jgi:putative cell wall-binding protein
MGKIVRVVAFSLALAVLVPSVAVAANRVSTQPKSALETYRNQPGFGSSRPAAPAVTTAVPDAWEDADDDYATNNVIGLSDYPFTQDHTLDTVADRDYYYLNSSPLGLYTIETITSVDTIVEVRDATTHEILAWFDDKSATDLGSIGYYENRSEVSAGGVYVVVRAANSVNGVGSYQISITEDLGGYFMPGETTRVEGKNRYAVAANTGRAMFPSWKINNAYPVTDVVIVNGEDRAMADPLAAGSLAGMYNAPILTVTANAIPAETATAITQIRNGNGGGINIHVIGGTGSVSAGVYRSLTSAKGASGSIDRIAGANRFELAAAIAARVDEIWVETHGHHAPGVFIANGENANAFSDALAASAICNRMGWPLLLTQNTKVHGATQTALAGTFADSATYMVNSTTYLPASVYNAAKHAESGRISSHTDRYNSAIDIAKWGMERKILSTYEVVLVNKLSDAVAAGAYTGWYGGVLLYTPLNGPGTATDAYLRKRPSMIRYGTLFGGTGSISATTFNKVRTMLNPNM